MEIKMKESPKYRQPQKIEIENRQWPTRMIEKAPLWVPVDLRDGNQAFAKPMNVEKKIRYFKMLTAMRTIRFHTKHLHAIPPYEI